MYTAVQTSRFKKSYKRIKKHKDFKQNLFDFVIAQLLNKKPLDSRFKDHELKGDYIGYRECHIQNDILLLYFYKDMELVLVLADIGSHSELF